MKRTPFIAFALMVLLCATSALAKDNAQDIPKYLKDKHDYIVKQTGMTQAQLDKFMPIYEAMEKEIYAVNHTARDQAEQVSTSKKVTDQDYYNAALALSQTKTKEGEIEKRYFERFSKILSKKQMFLLKQAERMFRQQRISQGKGKKK